MPRLEIPSFFNPKKVETIWRVPYAERAKQALDWAKAKKIHPASQDKHKIGLLIVDAQNTFCLPDFELFVGGQSGRGAIEDNQRLCQFIYQNLDRITEIHATLDTHVAMQIFHPMFWRSKAGHPPDPFTVVTLDSVASGEWRLNPEVTKTLGLGDEKDVQAYLTYYCERLKTGGKYDLMIWPYHAMLGGVGHALVSAVEEALFFHTIARQGQTRIHMKGNHPMTENYSAITAEVSVDQTGRQLLKSNPIFLQRLQKLDALIIAGQAKSHCVAWTVSDLLKQIQETDSSLAEKVYLLTDCSSPVVIPNGVDFTDQADQAYKEFESAGMHLVKSTHMLEKWPINF